MSKLDGLRRFLGSSVLARVGFAVAAILVAGALLAPWIAPADPAAQNLPARLASPPSGQASAPDPRVPDQSARP